MLVEDGGARHLKVRARPHGADGGLRLEERSSSWRGEPFSGSRFGDGDEVARAGAGPRSQEQTITPGAQSPSADRPGRARSTLLLCLAGVLRPDSGKVRFAGRRIDAEGESARSALRRREFGVLFQFGQLVAEMTAAENVALPLLLGGARRRAAQAAAFGWLDGVGRSRHRPLQPWAASVVGGG
jgi:ABC-type phosphonate transport system ATPase subunit